MVKTRTGSKAEVFLMLDERKNVVEFHDDFQRESIFSKCSFHDKILGWACTCMLTRMNYTIGLCAFTLTAYVLFETTYVFENIRSILLNRPIEEGNPDGKSLGRFLEEHYLAICLIGPIIAIGMSILYYLKVCKEELK